MKPFLRGLAAPVMADAVASPIVTHGDGPASIQFLIEDGRWGRVTFEKLDSLRISRGEHEPYKSNWRAGDPIHWVSEVIHSPWLRERYEYEKRHYGDAYEFGGDVDEMIRDFSHYLFEFHDEFVEAISTGIWFETSDQPIGNREPDLSHPLLDLPESSIMHRFEAHGIVCQVRQNPRPLDELLRDAAYCSQKLLQFAAELGGSEKADWTVSLRVREGRPPAYLKGYFGKTEAEYDSIPGLADVQPRIEAWLGEVKARRRQMGLP